MFRQKQRKIHNIFCTNQKKSNEDGTIIYRIKFIDSFRFMSTSLSTLVDNLSNRIYDNHKCDSCGYNLEYNRRKKSGKLLFKCFNCKRKFFEEFDEDLIKKFENTYRFCNGVLISLYFY